jgi:hypothetical protein
VQTINGIGTTIYGGAKKQELTSQERLHAEASGFLPYSYQVVKWFVIFYLPVIPLGTYRVLKVKQRFWSMLSPSYGMLPVPWDWSQVIRHYLIVYSIPLLILALIASRAADKLWRV